VLSPIKSAWATWLRDKPRVLAATARAREVFLIVIAPVVCGWLIGTAQGFSR
jgi:hypothetical protein